MLYFGFFSSKYFKVNKRIFSCLRSLELYQSLSYWFPYIPLK